jgi:hypothetical protein
MQDASPTKLGRRGFLKHASLFELHYLRWSLAPWGSQVATRHLRSQEQLLSNWRKYPGKLRSSPLANLASL